MKKREKIIFVILALFLFIFFYFSKEKPAREGTIVTNVIDGDTVVISGGERVRLLGIDAPEKGEFFYENSKKRLESLIEKKQVMLEKEAEEKDRYGRLLRYIFLDEANINLQLVGEGLANCYFYEKSRYQETCKELEEDARLNKKGIWKNSS